MEYKIEGRSVVTLEHNEGDKTSKHLSTDFNLNVSKNIEKCGFVGEDDLPTKEGTKALTQCFIQGLVGNIHRAHQKGYWNDADHIRYVISELEKGFVSHATIYNSTFKL